MHELIKQVSLKYDLTMKNQQNLLCKIMNIWNYQQGGGGDSKIFL